MESDLSITEKKNLKLEYTRMWDPPNYSMYPSTNVHLWHLNQTPNRTRKSRNGMLVSILSKHSL